MKDWTARDWIGWSIVVGLISWGLVLELGIMIRGGSMSDKGGEVLGLIAGGLVTALGLYFGKTNGKPPLPPKQ